MNNSNIANTALEHINFTVSDPDKTATLFTDLFGWRVRWSGESMDNGYTVHVGEKDIGGSYLSLYTTEKIANNPARGHRTIANLNHIGVTVADLEEIEARVLAQGLTTFNHAESAPGKRFYFMLDDDIEIEVVCYQ